MIPGRRILIADMPWVGGAQASLRFGPRPGDIELARPAARDFPTVEAVDRLEASFDTVAVDSSAWRDGDVDFYWVDAQADALGERGLVPVATAGEPLVRLELLTRCQRWLDRRNAHSEPPWFDQLLLFHRSLHDREKPLVRADHNHALDTWQWVLRLDPRASAALQVAALFHDVRRLTGAGQHRLEHLAAELDELALARSDESVRLLFDLLSGTPTPRLVAERACALVGAVEEDPFGGDGDGEVSVLEDADCLSFFALNSSGFLDYYGEAQTRRRIALTLRRLSLRACAYLPAVRLRRDVAQIFSEAATPG